jgi:hypothetical protein
MVSRAEREALDRAEELSRQAAEMLTLVRRRRPDPQHQNGGATGPPAANGTEGGGGSGSEHPEHPDRGAGDRRRDAMAARAQIEQQLRTELATLAGVLAQTRTDLEELLAAGTVIDLRHAGHPEPAGGLSAVTESHEAGVGRK